MRLRILSLVFLALCTLIDEASAQFNFSGGYNWSGPFNLSAAAAGGGGGGSTELFNDNFNRADETPLGGNWTGQTGEGESFKLATSAVNPITDGDCGAYRNNVTWPADQYMEADCTAVAAGNGIGVALRMATGSKILYRVIIDNAGTINVEKLVPGYTLITTRSVTYSAGAKLRAEISGSTIKVFYQGVQQGANITDSSIASGSGGICYSSSNGTGCKIDNAAGGSIP